MNDAITTSRIRYARPLRALALAALAFSAAIPRAAQAASLPVACTLLTSADLSRLFPGDPIDAGHPAGPVCEWIAHTGAGRSIRVALTLKPAQDFYDSQAFYSRLDASQYHPLTGIGDRAFFAKTGGIYFLKGSTRAVVIVTTNTEVTLVPLQERVAKTIASHLP